MSLAMIASGSVIFLGYSCQGNRPRLSEFIMGILKQHKGKKKAITRERLLGMLYPYDITLTDRRLREIYSKLPIVTSAEGLFIPISSEEIEEFKQYLKAKALSLFERFTMLKQAYPNLIPETGKQLDFNW